MSPLAEALAKTSAESAHIALATFVRAENANEKDIVIVIVLIAVVAVAVAVVAVVAVVRSSSSPLMLQLPYAPS